MSDVDQFAPVGLRDCLRAGRLWKHDGTDRKEKPLLLQYRQARDNEPFVLPAIYPRRKTTQVRYPNRPRIAAEGRMEYFKRFANHSSKSGTVSDSPKVLIYLVAAGRAPVRP
jgi:hypothetical protein